MSITGGFPASWRTSVTVERSGGTDARGIPLGSMSHEVADCLVSVDRSSDVDRSDEPETDCYVFAPEGSDFQETDVVTVPASGLWPHGRFTVLAEPAPYPLGVRVPLRRS